MGINFNDRDIKTDDKFVWFPSPRGDKFQQTARQLVGSMYRFRPLTGLNFNNLLEDLTYGKDVSVPSRG